jgi:hypothetical protein
MALKIVTCVLVVLVTRLFGPERFKCVDVTVMLRVGEEASVEPG